MFTLRIRTLNTTKIPLSAKLILPTQYNLYQILTQFSIKLKAYPKSTLSAIKEMEIKP